MTWEEVVSREAISRKFGKAFVRAEQGIIVETTTLQAPLSMRNTVLDLLWISS